MQIKKIGKRNYMVTEKFSGWDLNLHWIEAKHGNYVIDSGCGAENMEPIRQLLEKNGKPIILINTHHHYDHVWGNHVFADKTIISHKLCWDILEEEWERECEQYASYMRGKVEKCLPNMVFDNTLYFPLDKIRLFYAPGHTPDSICIYDEEDKVLDVGDNIGDDMENVVPGLECSAELYSESLALYESLPFEICLSGHNIPVGREIIFTIRAALGFGEKE